MQENKSYTAENNEKIRDLPTLREEYDFEVLSGKVKKRGDLIKVSRELSVNRSVLSRAIYEKRILSLLPGINKSKVTSLSTMKVNREVKEFANIYDVYKLSARKLYRAVRDWRKRLMLNPRLLLTDLQHDLIIGSTLGDAYVRQRNKNCNFRVAHSEKQERYLLWKYEILKEFTLSPPVWGLRQFKNLREIKTLELSTFTHPAFKFYRELFYINGKKKITQGALDLLNSRSLAVWICDDGSYDNRQGYIVLCTNYFSLEEHKIMKKYFQDVWKLDPTIGFRDNKYYYLRFKQEDSSKLISIIKPFIPNGMGYKIGEKNDN